MILIFMVCVCCYDVVSLFSNLLFIVTKVACYFSHELYCVYFTEYYFQGGRGGRGGRGRGGFRGKK